MQNATAGRCYTSFEYINLRISKKEIGQGEVVKVSVEITNTGKRKGDEVVQLYINDVLSSVTRPVKELKGFSKVALESGETKTVMFKINILCLCFSI